MNLTRNNGESIVRSLHNRDGVVYCASEKAIIAAAEAYPDNDAAGLTAALIALHHPSLGIDRSVCLGDLVSDEVAELIGQLLYDTDDERPRVDGVEWENEPDGYRYLFRERARDILTALLDALTGPQGGAE